jgi:hypothetical protein
VNEITQSAMIETLRQLGFEVIYKEELADLRRWKDAALADHAIVEEVLRQRNEMQARVAALEEDLQNSEREYQRLIMACEASNPISFEKRMPDPDQWVRIFDAEYTYWDQPRKWLAEATIEIVRRCHWTHWLPEPPVPQSEVPA